MTGHGEKGWGGHFDPHLAATAAALSYIGHVHFVTLLPFTDASLVLRRFHRLAALRSATVIYCLPRPPHLHTADLSVCQILRASLSYRKSLHYKVAFNASAHAA